MCRMNHNLRRKHLPHRSSPQHTTAEQRLQKNRQVPHARRHRPSRASPIPMRRPNQAPIRAIAQRPIPVELRAPHHPRLVHLQRPEEIPLHRRIQRLLRPLLHRKLQEIQSVTRVCKARSRSEVQMQPPIRLQRRKVRQPRAMRQHHPRRHPPPPPVEHQIHRRLPVRLVLIERTSQHLRNRLIEIQAMLLHLEHHPRRRRSS